MSQSEHEGKPTQPTQKITLKCPTNIFKLTTSPTMVTFPEREVVEKKNNKNLASVEDVKLSKMYVKT